MVRRDDDGSPAGDPGENPSSRCGDPAGASPVSVSGNAPSSRLPARGEIPASEADPVLRGWGQYFRTGNAADKFVEIDKYVGWRLKRMRIRRKGRHLKPGEARRWSRHYFYALGLTKLSGTVAYPEAA